MDFKASRSNRSTGKPFVTALATANLPLQRIQEFPIVRHSGQRVVRGLIAQLLFCFLALGRVRSVRCR
jgi:hypothetical protein